MEEVSSKKVTDSIMKNQLKLDIENSKFQAIRAKALN